MQRFKAWDKGRAVRAPLPNKWQYCSYHIPYGGFTFDSRLRPLMRSYISEIDTPCRKYKNVLREEREIYRSVVRKTSEIFFKKNDTHSVFILVKHV